MTLDKFLNFFLDKDVTKSLSQKYFRQIVARLTDVEQKKIREIACQIMLKTNDKQIIDNAIKIYASTLGKRALNNYASSIEKRYSEDYLLFKKLGIFQERKIDNFNIAYYKHWMQIRSDLMGQFYYIKKNILDFFPGRVQLAKELIVLLSNLKNDEIIVLFEYLSLILYDNIENADDLSEALKIFRWMRLDDEIKIGVTSNLTGFISWLYQGSEYSKDKFKFKIIFLNNLLVTAKKIETVCSTTAADDAIFINILKNSIVDHLFFTSKNIEYLENIFLFNNTESEYSKEKVKEIIRLIDNTKIEISFKKLKKKMIKEGMYCPEQKKFPQTELASVFLGEHSEWIEDNPQVSIRKNGVNLRPNQQSFRNSVMDKYGILCSVCSIDILELIEAAHIIPKKDRGTDVPENGIPLCVLHHKAYDANLFCIHPDNLSIEVNPSGPTPEQLLITKSHIDKCTSPPREVLAWRWNAWFEFVKKQ